jgi:hypothetical protein
LNRRGAPSEKRAPPAAVEILDRWGPLHRGAIGEKSATHGIAEAPSRAAIAAPLPDEVRSLRYPATN